MKTAKIAWAGASLFGLAVSLFAETALAQSQPQTPAQTEVQAEPEVGTVGEDIVVTARRREESKQDVPLVVQAVSGNDLTKLNLREFKEVSALVPGLTLSQDANGIATQATLRGVAFNAGASGNNGTIEFYMNDAPLSAAILFQSMFDVGQIEVLRGPQGTLRGRASPSGSITVTTRKPDLYNIGATVVGTTNTWGNANVQAAVNVPLIKDMLAIRVAGVYDETDDNRVRSINNAEHPNRRTKGGRISIRFDPVDGLTFNGSYNITDRTLTNFDQVESANLADPALPASPVLITASDRLAVVRTPRTFRQKFQVWNWSAEYRFLGQKLNYVGSHSIQDYSSFGPNDLGAGLPATTRADLINAGQPTFSSPRQTNHEIRLSSDERVLGIFDYVVGYLNNKLDNPTTLEVQTPVFRGSYATPLLLNRTAVVRGGASRETSFFGNLTAHLTENDEISGGVRRIKYRSLGSLSLNGAAVAAANEDRTFHATIFSLSAKHKFTRDLMAYVNYGTSWRPGPATNPIQVRSQPNITGDLASNLYPNPEKSKSIEVGIKSEWFDRVLRVNVDYFHQTFENFAYSANNVFFLGVAGANPTVLTATTFTTGVAAKVDGVEAEIGLRPSRNLSIDATVAWSLGKITGGTVACNPTTGVATVADFTALGQQMRFCPAPNGLRAGTTAPFVATVQAEYTRPLTASADGYLRTLVTFNGKSLSDPLNPVDDVRAYALANLYAGVRDPKGMWELGAFVKNLFDVERVTSRVATAAPTLASVVGGTPTASTYRVITMTPPREIGLTLRVSFGGR